MTKIINIQQTQALVELCQKFCNCWKVAILKCVLGVDGGGANSSSKVVYYMYTCILHVVVVVVGVVVEYWWWHSGGGGAVDSLFKNGS